MGTFSRPRPPHSFGILRTGYHRAQVSQGCVRRGGLIPISGLILSTSYFRGVRTMLILEQNLGGVLYAFLLSVFMGLHNVRDYTGVLATTAFGRDSVSNVGLFTALVRHRHF